MSKRLGFFAAFVLALVLMSPAVRSQAPAKNPFDGREVVHEVSYIREPPPTI